MVFGVNRALKNYCFLRRLKKANVKKLVTCHAFIFFTFNLILISHLSEDSLGSLQIKNPISNNYKRDMKNLN